MNFKWISLLLVFVSDVYADQIQKRWPIVFAHGLGVPAIVYETVIPLKKIFNQFGYEVYIANTPVTDVVENRAKSLSDEIERLVPDGRFHIVAHSMGGLDARLAIHRYNLGARCASLTTIATPHRGSPVADFLLKHFGEGDSSFGNMIGFLKSLFGNDLNVIQQLSTKWVTEVFNTEVVDDPRVSYFSMSFYIPVPVSLYSKIPWLWLTHYIVAGDEGLPNDGMVSVHSSKWGESLGTWASDHYSETAPTPFAGGKNYRDVFAMVLNNVDAFEKK